jgi:regulator of protease activity HflC (stomatin/prohibitin superfamily)
MDIAGLFRGAAGLLFFAAVGLIFLAIARSGQGRPMKGAGRIVVIIGVVALVLAILSMGVVTIEPLERGVVTSYLTFLNPKGYRDAPLQPGINFILPIFEKVNIYSIAKQTYTMSIAPSEGQIEGDDSVAARTADGQEIYVDASVIYKIDPDKVVTVHIFWQNRFTDELVRPQTRGIIRNVISQYGVEEVITSKRAEMVQQIAGELALKMGENGLVMEDFILRNITFSQDYANSIEQKQIAEQQALQAAFVVQQKKQEAQQAIETAKGQAESVKIAAEGDAGALKINAQAQADARLIQAEAEAQALEMIAAALKNNSDLLTYQYITKLAPNVQVMYLPSGQPYLIPLPTESPR